MKKLLISILLTTLSLPALAAKQDVSQETPKLPKGAVIEEDLKLEKGGQVNAYKMYGSLKAIDKNKANAMRLQGKVFVGPYDDKNCKGCYMANIHWVGIQKIDSPDKVVGFKEPIISSFLFKQGADIKNISLPTFGDEQDLKRAIQDLEQGKIDAEDLKRVRKFKAAHSKQDKGARWLVDKGKTRKLLTAVNTGELKAVEPSEDLKTALNDGDLSNNARTFKESSHASSGYDAAHFNLNQGANGYGNLPGFQNNGQQEKQPKNKLSNAENISPPDNIKRLYKHSKDYDLYLLDRIDEENPPQIDGDAVVIAQGNDGKKRAYFVRKGKFVRNKNGKLASKEVDINVDLAVDDRGKVIKNNDNKEYIENLINELMFGFNENADNKENQPIDFGPEIRIELTTEGCNPEHEVLQERIVITSRAKKYENNVLVDEGICERTLENYPIKKDYLCEECVDEVDLEKKKAFARYQEHWFDKEGVRHNLGIKVDESEPFDIHEEIKDCGFDTESEQGHAIQMSVLGYLNKFKGFQTIENCRTSEFSKKYPVTETTKSCDILHDFPSKISYLQNRLVFTVKNAERQARGCEKIEPGLEHQFTKMGCKPLVNVEEKSVVRTAKRFININGATKLITEVCEPLIEEPLKETRNGCEGEYYHDFTAGIHGRSYIKKRYYYDTDHGPKYVTSCVATADYLHQSTERNGKWVHDDAKKESRPELGVFIECLERGKINISDFRVRGDHSVTPYMFSATVIENGKKVNIYYRGGGTSYREPAND